MKRTTIKSIFAAPEAYASAPVTVGGWVRTVRDSKAFGFIELNDGSCFACLQIVLHADKLNNFTEAVHLNVGTAVVVTGCVLLTPDAQQPFELVADSVVVEGSSAPDFPLQKKRHSLEYLRTIAHLRPRTNTFNAVFRVRNEAAWAIHEFFHSRGFIWAHTPIITGSDGEGAGEMFAVTTVDPGNPPRDENGAVDYTKDFFGRPVSLTVTGQLEGETFAMAFGNIYTFGPTFRAERSNTTRHAAEFWMVEPEIAFADLNDNMELAEAMLKHIINHLLAVCPDELAFFDKFVENGLVNRLAAAASAEFARVSYTEAIDILAASGQNFDFPVRWGMDIQTEHERYLAEKHFVRPVFVTDYPKEIKAFYMRLNDDGKTVAAMDMLVPGVGELIGGSQREERLDVLRARMAELKLDEKDYWWYLDLRRYGGTKHAGYGIGFERLIMYVTGMGNIRDVIPYPRTTGSAEF